MHETYCQVVAQFLELNKLVKQTAAHVLHEQYSTCLRTTVLLVVAGTSILSIRDMPFLYNSFFTSQTCKLQNVCR